MCLIFVALTLEVAWEPVGKKTYPYLTDVSAEAGHKRQGFRERW